MALRIVSFILFALTIIAAYGGRVNPNYLMEPSALTLLLPYLAILTMLVTVAWLCCGRYITAAVGVLALVASWGSVSTVIPLHGSQDPSPGSKTFKVMTYNILHGDDQQNPDTPSGNRSIEFLIESGADIVCLQEMIYMDSGEIHNFTPSLRDSLFKAYPYHAGSTALDNKVLSKYPIRLLNRKTYSDEADADYFRYSFYEIEIEGRKLNLVNMHFRSFMLSKNERNVMKDIASIKNMKKGVDEMKGSIRQKLRYGFIERAHNVGVLRRALDKIQGPLIVCGDLNDVPESYAYRLMRGTDLRDACVETTFGPMITYNRHAFWFHLDQILYRGPLKALSVTKGKLKSSDHYPLTAEFEFTD